jgi:hypothetical protein
MAQLRHYEDKSIRLGGEQNHGPAEGGDDQRSRASHDTISGSRRVFWAPHLWLVHAAAFGLRGGGADPWPMLVFIGAGLIAGLVRLIKFVSVYDRAWRRVGGMNAIDAVITQRNSNLFSITKFPSDLCSVLPGGREIKQAVNRFRRSILPAKCSEPRMALCAIR